jgi:hypothetical protein
MKLSLGMLTIGITTFPWLSWASAPHHISQKRLSKDCLRDIRALGRTTIFMRNGHVSRRLTKHHHRRRVAAPSTTFHSRKATLKGLEHKLRILLNTVRPC